MTESKQEVIVYITNDGKEFSNKYAAEEHEAKFVFTEKRNAFLTEQLTTRFKEIDELLTAVVGNSSENVKIFVGDREMDECFDSYLNRDQWNEITEEFQIKYGIVLSIPYWYYSK